MKNYIHTHNLQNYISRSTKDNALDLVFFVCFWIFFWYECVYEERNISTQ